TFRLLLKRAGGRIVKLHWLLVLALAKPGTTTAKIFKTLNFAIHLFTTSCISSSTKSESELLEEGLLAQGEPTSSPQLYEHFDLPPLPPGWLDDLNAEISATRLPALATYPTPSEATSAADLPSTVQHTDGTDSKSTESETSVYLSSHPVVSITGDGMEITSNVQGPAPAAPMNVAAAPNNNTAQQSTVVLPSLAGSAGDHSSTNQIEPEVFAKMVLLSKRSRKVALKGLNALKLCCTPVPRLTIREDLPDSSSPPSHSSANSANCAISAATSPPPSTWSSVITATSPCSTQIRPQLRYQQEASRDATAFTRAKPTHLAPPQIIINERFSDSSLSLSNSPNSNPSTTTLAPSTLTPGTTPASSVLDVKSDVEGKVSTALPETTSRDVTHEAHSPKSGSEKANGRTVAPRLEERHASNRRAKFRIPTSILGRFKNKKESKTTEEDRHWQWAKREGKQPEGGRRPHGQWSGLGLACRTTTTAAGGRPLQQPGRVPPIGDETDSEEDDVDEAGFSKKEQEKAMAESKQAATRAVVRPFYGASTSSAANGPLSQNEWDNLKQYEAVSWSWKEDVGPDEIVAPTGLPPPKPRSQAAPPKAKLLPRLKNLIKKITPWNRFTTRRRADLAH
ncbi:hypothetical protein FRC01_010882, partial [Tulasnella sp. 417]